MNKYLHFDNHINSREENSNVTLKVTLQNFTNDLNSIIKITISIYDRQRFKNVLIINDVKKRLSRRLNKNIF